MPITYTDNRQIATEIKKLMLDNNTTQRSVAEKLGMSPQLFNKLMNKKNFSFSDSQKILSALGYDLTIDFVKRKSKTSVHADIPNDDTIEAIQEIENGGGFKYSSVKELFADLESD